MRYLTLGEVIELHDRLLEQAGGAAGIGHASMETFLLLNGLEIDASVDEQERLMLDLAAGGTTRSALAEWLTVHTKPAK